jgi:ribonuclease J
MTAPVSVTFLGGLGEIGRNCAAIEVEVASCCSTAGSCSPTPTCWVSTSSCPTSRGCSSGPTDIEGCILTHGHEDHVGRCPTCCGSCRSRSSDRRSTLGLASSRIEEAGLLDRTELIVVKDNERRSFGPFDCEFIPVTHSVPHGFATAFHTPQGTILHSGDFKLDLTRSTAACTDLATMGAIAQNEGIRLLLSDSTNADEHGHSRSERSVGKVLYDLFARQRRAAHHHRLLRQPHPPGAADRRCRRRFDRVIATLGRSMKKNVKDGPRDGAAEHPRRNLRRHRGRRRPGPGQVCVISTGIPGRADVGAGADGRGREPWLKLDDQRHRHPLVAPDPRQRDERVQGDRQPGAPRGAGRPLRHRGRARHRSRQGRRNSRPSSRSSKPEWFVPVHGEYRHLVAHAELARTMGVAPTRS